MKRITKGTEPDEFSRWKEQDNMAQIMQVLLA